MAKHAGASVKLSGSEVQADTAEQDLGAGDRWHLSGFDPG